MLYQTEKGFVAKISDCTDAIPIDPARVPTSMSPSRAKDISAMGQTISHILEPILHNFTPKAQERIENLIAGMKERDPARQIPLEAAIEEIYNISPILRPKI